MHLNIGCSLPLDIPAPLASFAPRGQNIFSSSQYSFLLSDIVAFASGRLKILLIEGAYPLTVGLPISKIGVAVACCL